MTTFRPAHRKPAAGPGDALPPLFDFRVRATNRPPSPGARTTIGGRRSRSPRGDPPCRAATPRAMGGREPAGAARPARPASSRVTGHRAAPPRIAAPSVRCRKRRRARSPAALRAEVAERAAPAVPMAFQRDREQPVVPYASRAAPSRARSSKQNARDMSSARSRIEADPGARDERLGSAGRRGRAASNRRTGGRGERGCSRTGARKRNGSQSPRRVPNAAVGAPPPETGAVTLACSGNSFPPRIRAPTTPFPSGAGA